MLILTAEVRFTYAQAFKGRSAYPWLFRSGSLLSRNCDWNVLNFDLRNPLIDLWRAIFPHGALYHLCRILLTASLTPSLPRIFPYRLRISLFFRHWVGVRIRDFPVPDHFFLVNAIKMYWILSLETLELIYGALSFRIALVWHRLYRILTASILLYRLRMSLFSGIGSKCVSVTYRIWSLLWRKRDYYVLKFKLKYPMIGL